MSKIENSMLKGWEFIIDAVALFYDVRTYQMCVNLALELRPQNIMNLYC